jgi:hypothetical protein
MKFTIQFLLAAFLFLFAGIKSLEIAGRYFVRDAHGSVIFGSDIQFKEYIVDWKGRSLILKEACIAYDKKSPVICMGNISLHLQVDFSPVLSDVTLAPDIWFVDKVSVNNISIFYDIDNEAADFLELRKRVSAAAANGMRNRLNADANNIAAPLKFRIGRVELSGNLVKAVSNQYRELSKEFPVKDLRLSEIGVSEGGVTAAEVIDKVSRVFFDEVQSEVERHIEISSPVVSESPSRKRQIKKEVKEEKVQESGGAKKEIKEFWQKTKTFSKSLFD